MTDVFISYSRKNSIFAHRLIDKLILLGKDAWVDWEGIPLTSPNWWTDIKTGIEGADSFVFIMSPDSMASVVCNMELDYAIELQKRIIPLVYQDVVTRDAFASVADFKPDEAMEERLGGKDPLIIARDNMQRLSDINWVFFRAADDFDSSFERLIKTVETDLPYVKAHTRYLTRAQEWEREKQREDLLLFGQEIDRAEAWLNQGDAYAKVVTSDERIKVDVVNPFPKDLQRGYIHASRAAETARTTRLRKIRRASLVGGIVAVVALIFAVGASLVGIQATNSSNQASIRESFSNTQIADANSALTAVPPRLTQVNQQASTAQGRADGASTQAADANSALTAVPPTLTQVNQQVFTAQGQANRASTQVADANGTLIAVPPTLNAISTNVAVGEARIESLRLAADANSALVTENNPELSLLLALRSLQSTYSSEADIQLSTTLDNLYTVQLLTGHSDIVRSVAFTPDDQYVLTASNDKTIRIWNSKTGQLIHILRGHRGTVNALAVSPDSRFVVTGSDDSTARIWSIETGETVRILSGHTDDVDTVAFSSNGALILTGSADTTVREWDATTGATLLTIPNESGVTSVAFSKDPNRIMVGTGGSYDYKLGYIQFNYKYLWPFTSSISLIRLPEIKIEEKFTSSVAYTVNRPTLSPDQTLILRVGEKNVAELIRSDNGQLVRQLVGQTGSIIDGAFTHDGRQLITASLDGTARLWDVQTGETIRIFDSHANGITSVAISFDNQFAIVGCEDGTARIWRLQNNGSNELLTGITDALSMSYAQNGQSILIGRNNGGIELLDSHNAQYLRHIPTGHLPVSYVAFLPKSKSILGLSGDNNINIWSGSMDPVYTFQSSGYRVPNLVTTSIDGQYFATDRANNAELLNISTGSSSLFLFTSGDSPVSGIAISPDNKQLMLVRLDGTITIWNINTKQIVHTIEYPNAVSANFSPNGRTILILGPDNAELLNLVSGEKQILATRAAEFSAFSENGDYLLMAPKQGVIQMFDTNSGQVVRKFPSSDAQTLHAAVIAIGFVPHSESVFIAYDNGFIIKRDITLSALIDNACLHAVRDFSDEERLQYSIPDNLPTCPQFH